MFADGGQGDEGRKVVGGLAEVLHHILLGGDVVVAPDGVIPQLLGLLRDTDVVPDVLHKGDGVHQALGAGGDAHAEFQFSLHVMLLPVVQKLLSPGCRSSGRGQR